MFGRREFRLLYNFHWKEDLSYAASQPTDPHLYPHHNAFFFDESCEWLSSAVLLIESLMEEDHSTNALVDGCI